MKNKIFFRIGLIFTLIVLIYTLFIRTIVSPKIDEYLDQVQLSHVKTQLTRITSTLEQREIHLKEHQTESFIDYKSSMKDIVIIIYNAMDKFYQIYKEGKISKDEVLVKFENFISKIGNLDKFVFLLDSKGTLLYHPDKTIIKENFIDLKDVTGKAFVKEIIEKTIKNNTSYTKYFWHKYSKTKEQEKIVYSIYFKPFDIIINYTLFLQDIKEQIKKEKEEILLQLNPLIKSIQNLTVASVFILNEDGKTLLFPKDIYKNLDFSKLINLKNNESMFNSIKKALLKQDNTLKYKLKPDKFIDVSKNDIAWVSYNDFFKWYVFLTIDKDRLQQKPNEINKLIINISLVILLTFLVISLFVLKKFLSPLNKLLENMNHVKNGKFHIRNNFKEKDEIGILASHFDKMMDYIEDNTKNLEEIVSKRTHELKYQLYHDKLTNLKNRRKLEKDISELELCALSLIDIKGFNDINELYGFKIGDQILLEVTRVLKEFCENNNISLYKLNADIFVVLDKDLQFIANYESILEKIEQLFAQNIYVEQLESNINLQIVMGISIAQDEPIKTANIALKKAKRKDLKYLVYSSDIDTKENIKNSMYWQMKIKDAIDNDKIVPFFQPIFNKEKQIVKYETLMRLYDENAENKYITPGSFLGIAAKTGQYFKLNQIVIKKAFSNIDIINKNISLNIGFNEIWNRDFTNFIDLQMEKLTKEQREKIVFEILESDFITDYKVFEDFTSKYRAKGLKIAIDDFGTGYSNFEHILKIKPDYIKIDGSLIKNIHTDENSYQMVKSIVAFSKSLGIKTIAEFIHNEEVYKVAQSLDIDEYQGFYLGEPMPLTRRF